MLMQHFLFTVFVIIGVYSEKYNIRNAKWLKPHVEKVRINIIGGDEAVPNEFPYQVGLWINDGNAFCGGSLISENYVLTAGHCGVAIFRNVEIVFGAHNITNEEEPTRMSLMSLPEDVTVHELYNYADISHDIALIKLPSPVKLTPAIQTIALPKRSDVTKDYSLTKVNSTGWGMTYDKRFPLVNDISDVLRVVTVEVMKPEDCQEFYNDDNETYVTVDKHICSSGYKNVGTCEGDSGGPIVQDGVQIGLTSFGDELCEACSPSVFTRIDAYLEWIEEHSDIKTLN